ncbi:MAG TPA: glycerate kinase, partial [Actinotalea sp.]|nr:glycerate kinase [Actinotalea sp.]
LLACAPAVVRPGAEVVLQAVGLPRALVGADLVLTGEGSVDAQTLRGKVPFAVARVAARAGVPVVVLGGRVGPVAEELLAHGVLAVVPIVRGVGDLAAALREGPANLEAAAATVLRLVVGRAGPPQRPGGPVASLDVPSEGREESTVTEDRELPQPPSNPPDAVTDADIDEIEAETQEGADPPDTARH